MFSGGQKETLGRNRLNKKFITYTVFSQELKKTCLNSAKKASKQNPIALF